MDRRYKRTAIRPFRGDMAKTQQSLLPSVSDPKLWMVRCREGKEKNVVMTLMRKFFERNRQATKNKNINVLKIHSVFCRDDLKGFIYVEADIGQHVQDALKEVFGVYLGKTRLVPVKEMTDVLTIQKDTQSVDLLKMEWVRIKRGKYAGDLARVVNITDTGDVCTVHLVPRLDLSGETKEKKKKKQGLLSRPPQKLFNPRDLPPSLARMVSKSQRGYWMLGPDAFKNGLLEKSVRVSALDTDCKPLPSLDEINAFVGSEGVIDTNTLQTLKSSITHRETSSHFRPGDQVLIISGELANVPAVISGISGNLATIQAMVPGLSTKTSLPLSQLSKRFSLGDLVKVNSGKHEGEIGTIVRLQGHIATVITTEGQREVHVTTRDLQDVKEITYPVAPKSEPFTNAKTLSDSKSMPEPPRFYGGQRRRDPLLGATVKIHGGSFKGYMGIIKHLTNEYARVELHTNCKTVTVLRDKISLRDETGTYSEPVDFPMNAFSAFSSSTPSLSFTPSFNSAASSQTPNPYSSSSSNNYAPQTPNPHASAQTPNPHSGRYGNDGHRTPAWDAGSRTPHGGDVHESNAWSADDPNPAHTHDWSAGNSGAWGKESSSIPWSSTNSANESWNRTPTFANISSSSTTALSSSSSSSSSSSTAGISSTTWGTTPTVESNSFWRNATDDSNTWESHVLGNSNSSTSSKTFSSSSTSSPWGTTPNWNDPRTPRREDDTTVTDGWGD
ncbi:transcription elongation factor spt5 [Coelomomyces lativittatus]|nr:transcription elongation factor spt5 [Coelomomyces lativittatus]